MKRSSIAALREDNGALEHAYQSAKALALKCAAERDALQRSIDDAHKQHVARIEALHADLRARAEERDAAQTEARKYAETRRLAADLQAELASLKIERAQIIETARQWKSEAMDAMLHVGDARAHAKILARLIVDNKQGAHELAEIILAKSKKKPCAP